jgi:hypothetical protein
MLDQLRQSLLSQQGTQARKNPEDAICGVARAEALRLEARRLTIMLEQLKAEALAREVAAA